MSLFQLTLMLLTCAGSLCMNLDRNGESRWKKLGVLLGLLAAPLWLASEYRDGAQAGMLVSSLWIWGTYFIGAWRLRHDLLVMLRLRKSTQDFWTVAAPFDGRGDGRLTGYQADQR